jgi:hypothetical protein
LHHIPGKTNIPSNFLSWPPVDDKGETDNGRVVMIPKEQIMVGNLVQVPPVLEIWWGLMQLFHDHLVAGHVGWDKTLQQLQTQYQWPYMKEWVANYIRGCAICQQNKILTHKRKVPPYWIGTLPDAWPFESVAMDLITGLPRQDGKDTILTIVDQGCSHTAIFLPCKTMITGAQIA